MTSEDIYLYVASRYPYVRAMSGTGDDRPEKINSTVVMYHGG